MKYLPDCLRSVFSQSYKDFSVLIIDNGSTDEMFDYLRENYGEKIATLRNFKNLGFSRGHNQGIGLAKKGNAEFILIINPDIILSSNFLENLVFETEKTRGGGSFGGKLLKIKERDLEEKGVPESKIIDSSGLKILKSRRVAERGGGERDNGQYEKLEEVFGVSGAAALYRLEALENIKINDEVFDEDFFAYKEDVDLAWRLRLLGWKAFYVPTAVAFHYRLASGKEKISVIETIKSRKEKPRTVNYFSYKNHFLMIFKNEYFSNFLIHFPYILWYELKKFIYLLFFEPGTLKSLVRFFIQLPKIWQKRKIIMSQARFGPEEMRAWLK